MMRATFHITVTDWRLDSDGRGSGRYIIDKRVTAGYELAQTLDTVARLVGENWQNPDKTRYTVEVNIEREEL